MLVYKVLVSSKVAVKCLVSEMDKTLEPSFEPEKGRLFEAVLCSARLLDFDLCFEDSLVVNELLHEITLEARTGS